MIILCTGNCYLHGLVDVSCCIWSCTPYVRPGKACARTHESDGAMLLALTLSLVGTPCCKTLSCTWLYCSVLEASALTVCCCSCIGANICIGQKIKCLLYAIFMYDSLYHILLLRPWTSPYAGKGTNKETRRHTGLQNNRLDWPWGRFSEQF